MFEDVNTDYRFDSAHGSERILALFKSGWEDLHLVLPRRDTVTEKIEQVGGRLNQYEALNVLCE